MTTDLLRRHAGSLELRRKLLKIRSHEVCEFISGIGSAKSRDGELTPTRL
jgi:hypothetical protein